MKILSTLVVLCLLSSVSIRPLFAAGPTTIDNDDSCEVIVTPAATLLLPYFEVDVENAAGETTIFTITNVTQNAQIARVTLWTDLAYPVLNFNIFLTGYDVQTINLFDIIARGRIAEPGTTSDSDTGRRSLDNDENPLLDLTNCDRLAVIIRQPLLADLQSAFTTGRTSRCGTSATGAIQTVGGTHTNAVGYVTIDVVRACGTINPTDSGYFTGELLYDNVLIGDYEQINSSQNFAQSGPMVHIRAVPEGSDPDVRKTNFVRTFYSRLQSGRTADRRQPLPSTFAARWIEGGSTGFTTSFKIWRDGLTGTNAGCSVSPNRQSITEIVRFDEVENATTSECSLCDPPAPVLLPATSRTNSADISLFPPNAGANVAGWMYLNLDRGLAQSSGVAAQGWVVVSMKADGRYSVDFDAASFGNGCSPRTMVTADRRTGDPAIGPAPNSNATFARGSPSTTNNDDSCDIRVTPAATLLLPYFQVDLANPAGETTLFTVTNVTRLPQIAHVTIWTDAAFPLYSFNVFLTGYDVQSINLFDVLSHGRLPATGSNASAGRRSAGNDANPLLDLATCASSADGIPAAVLADVQGALTLGRTSGCGVARVGATHANAIGYVTVDVVDRCTRALPTDANYFTRELLFDNVLIGDYQQVNSSKNFAQGGTMVHIRAIPEGGRSDRGTAFARTFYSRLQSGRTADRRQPLPSTFAARWISGGSTGFNTGFKIWREVMTTASAGCAVSTNLAQFSDEVVRFDEEENPTTFTCDEIIPIHPPCGDQVPATSRLGTQDSRFPPNPDGAVAGWMYSNLNNPVHVQSPVDVATQAWVVVSMEAEGRYSADFDAASLGNGCSPAVGVTDEDGALPVIGPAPNRHPHP